MKNMDQKSKNFLIMILFLVFAISGAKVLHDVTAPVADQAAVEITTEKEFASKQ